MHSEVLWKTYYWCIANQDNTFSSFLFLSTDVLLVNTQTQTRTPLLGLEEEKKQKNNTLHKSPVFSRTHNGCHDTTLMGLMCKAWQAAQRHSPHHHHYTHYTHTRQCQAINPITVRPSTSPWAQKQHGLSPPCANHAIIFTTLTYSPRKSKPPFTNKWLAIVRCPTSCS